MNEWGWTASRDLKVSELCRKVVLAGLRACVSCQVSRNTCRVELQQSSCLLAALSTELDSSRVFCVLWCPWAGAGMVGSSPSIFSFSATRECRDCLGG